MAIAQPCLSCGTPTAGTYCSDCKPEYGYDARSWRGPGGTRERVLERDGRRCLLRVDAGCTGTATTVHRLPEHGTMHDTNDDAYVSACAHCHGVVDGARSTRDPSREPARNVVRRTRGHGRTVDTHTPEE